MKTIERIGAFSLARAAGVIYAVIGLIIGILTSIMRLAMWDGRTGMMDGLGGASGVLFGIGSIVVVPILYGIGGFIGGFIVGFFYNITARYIGGIEVELRDVVIPIAPTKREIPGGSETPSRPRHIAGGVK